MESEYIRALAPQGSKILHRCKITATLDWLEIDCPAADYSQLVAEINDYTPCALEVRRVYISMDGVLQFEYSVSEFLDLKSSLKHEPS
jgi:hypothetical protein